MVIKVSYCVARSQRSRESTGDLNAVNAVIVCCFDFSTLRDLCLSFK